MRKRLEWIRRIAGLLIVGLATGCGDGKSGPTGPDPTAHSPMDQAAQFDLVGTWAVVSIQGSPVPVGPENSLWTFRSDGNYDWFLDLEPFDLKGSGTYTLNGNTLSLTGVMVDEDVIGGTSVNLGLVLGNVSFFFPDADGDEWAYQKCQ